MGGIFYGWPAYVFVLKEEGIFHELCENSTTSHSILSNSSSSRKYEPCAEQDTYYNMLFVIGCALSNMCGLIFGFVLDKFGLLACRITTGVPMTLGLILMIFYDVSNALVLGLELIAFAALGSLMTNLTLQPIWPKRTSTIGSMFSGTFDGSAATFMIVKVI